MLHTQYRISRTTSVLSASNVLSSLIERRPEPTWSIPVFCFVPWVEGPGGGFRRIWGILGLWTPVSLQMPHLSKPEDPHNHKFTYHLSGTWDPGSTTTNNQQPPAIDEERWPTSSGRSINLLEVFSRYARRTKTSIDRSGYM